MCGESGLIRERLQGRREQSCWQLREGGTENRATRYSAWHLRLHASQPFCGHAGMSEMSFVRRNLHGSTLLPNLLFVGIEAWRKVYTIRQRVYEEVEAGDP